MFHRFIVAAAARSYQGRKLTERTHFYSHSCMWAPPKHRGGIKQAAQHWQVCTGCTKQWRWSISLCRLDLGNAMGWSWWCSEWRWVGSSSSSGAKLVYWSLPKPTHTHTHRGGEVDRWVGPYHDWLGGAVRQLWAFQKRLAPGSTVNNELILSARAPQNTPHLFLNKQAHSRPTLR